MKPIYCISGLGADERVFKKLNIQADLQFVQWVKPEPGETIQNYAHRLSSQIKDDNPIIIGLSFGGMMAIELSRILSISKVILISSVKSEKELPFWMRTCGQWKLDRALPDRPLGSIPGSKAIRPIQNYFLGASTEEEKRIANEYRDNIDPQYLKWSINQVLNWKNDWLPSEMVHIHGNKDHIFPLKKVKPTHVINGGGHFMIMNHHKEISNILKEVL